MSKLTNLLVLSLEENQFNEFPLSLEHRVNIVNIGVEGNPNRRRLEQSTIDFL